MCIPTRLAWLCSQHGSTSLSTVQLLGAFLHELMNERSVFGEKRAHTSGFAAPGSEMIPRGRSTRREKMFTAGKSFPTCKLRLSSRHDSGLKSGIVFDKSHTKALLSQRFAVGLARIQILLELFCCRERFSFRTQCDGFFPTQTVRRAPQVEDLAMMEQAINNRHH